MDDMHGVSDERDQDQSPQDDLSYEGLQPREMPLCQWDIDHPAPDPAVDRDEYELWLGERRSYQAKLHSDQERQKRSDQHQEEWLKSMGFTLPESMERIAKLERLLVEVVKSAEWRTSLADHRKGTNTVYLPTDLWLEVEEEVASILSDPEGDKPAPEEETPTIVGWVVGSNALKPAAISVDEHTQEIYRLLTHSNVKVTLTKEDGGEFSYILGSDPYALGGPDDTDSDRLALLEKRMSVAEMRLDEVRRDRMKDWTV
jgi:hypothetical protein